MATPFIGQIILVPYNYAPRGYAYCDGQLLSIAQNTALFSLVGTTYGGNGQTTFALPDLRGRVPLGRGQGPGLSPRTLGEMSGAESVTLLANNLPGHAHLMTGSNAPGLADNPAGAAPAVGGSYGAGDVGMASTGANPTSNVPVPNMQPYLTLAYCIAMQGIWPSRS